eukprot:m.14047 g.14047  ORF g.14047 m.14047 type:complete len:501 (+) comp25438_c0_seq1:719-2221(+)
MCAVNAQIVRSNAHSVSFAVSSLFGRMVLLLFLVAALCVIPVLRVIFWRVRPRSRSICVVVLGDIGRSPRMQYHAISFADSDFLVDLVGFPGSKPLQKLTNHSNVKIIAVSDIFKWIKMDSFPLLRYASKFFIQLLQLVFTLFFFTRRPKHFLVQNPPSLPTLLAVYLVCLLSGSHMVVDWHNYGYTILQLALKPGHLLVRAAKVYEQTLGTFATSNLCVTEAMREDLKNNWNIQAVTLYDRPPLMFQKTPIEVAHKLFLRLSQKYPTFRPQPRQSQSVLQPSGGLCEETAFTYNRNDKVELRSDRPFLLLSSTSWTEDEDFSILLQSLENYEVAAKEKSSRLPCLLCVITGKGPQKKMYEDEIAGKSFDSVQFCLPWLEAEDYPLLLGSADLGVSLHKSSSGLDLPMKVVDMFGCGLPVCAFNFNCLHELVKHGVNGLTFCSALGLTNQIQRLARDFPESPSSELNTFRQNLKSFQTSRWKENWTKTALPLFMNASPQK